MKICPQCKECVKESARFCPDCGFHFPPPPLPQAAEEARQEQPAGAQPLKSGAPVLPFSPRRAALRRRQERDAFAVIGLTLGIIGLVFSCLGVFTLALSTAGIVFSALGVASARRRMAVSGLVLNIIALAAALAVTVSVLLNLYSFGLTLETFFSDLMLL